MEGLISWGWTSLEVNVSQAKTVETIMISGADLSIQQSGPDFPVILG